MREQFKYSFDDEVITNSSYDFESKKIVIHFGGYSDLSLNKGFLNKPCILNIQNWQDAHIRINDEKEKYWLEAQLGIFSLILSIKQIENDFEFLVNTIDNRFLYIYFSNPEIDLIMT